MITYIKGNPHTHTTHRGLLWTFTLMPNEDGPPETGTLTDTWDYGTYSFDTNLKDSRGIRVSIYTRGPRV